MTLHNAIVKVLSITKQNMSVSDLASILNTNKWYEKKDGSPIKSSQISARVKNYPHLFIKSGSYISLKSKTGITSSKSSSKTKLKKVAGKKLDNSLAMKMLMNEKNFNPVPTVKNHFPNQSGLYCIRIKNINALKGIFKKELERRGHNIIYIGIASKSIHKRLSQELYAKGHGTFFRSLGSMLGYLPPKGSLINKKNKNNYKFSPQDESKIISWIEEHLLVNWLEINIGLNELEYKLIKQYVPLLNLAGNPGALNELKELRNKCKRIAVK